MLLCFSFGSTVCWPIICAVEEVAVIVGQNIVWMTERGTGSVKRVGCQSVRCCSFTGKKCSAAGGGVREGGGGGG